MTDFARRGGEHRLFQQIEWAMLCPHRLLCRSERGFPPFPLSRGLSQPGGKTWVEINLPGEGKARGRQERRREYPHLTIFCVIMISTLRNAF
jgi:hypothetical protein